MNGLARKVVEHLQKNNLKISAAESCTGGMITSTLVNIPGSSVVLGSSFVTYSNKSKTRILGVPEEDLENFGAVSEVVARKMAQGARVVSRADIGVSSTGIAGPDGGSDEKPVGLVYIAISTGSKTVCRKFRFVGSRNTVRKKTTKSILKLILEETGYHEGI